MVQLACHESMAYTKKILQRSGMYNTLKTTSFTMGPKQIGNTIRPLEDRSTLSYDFMVTFHLGSIENLYIPNFLITLKEKIFIMGIIGEMEWHSSSTWNCKKDS